MTFGELLRRERKKKGFTQEMLGEKVGMTQVAIGQFERGDSTPKIETIAKFADALDVKTENLIPEIRFEEDDNEFPNRIREIRKEKNISQAKLAEMIGTSASTIQGYEYGFYKPKFDTACKIADALDVDVEVLMPEYATSGKPSRELDDSRMAFANKLKDARKSRRLSLTELADIMEVTPSFISQYENGYRIPKTATIEKFANALHMEVDDLMLDGNESASGNDGYPELLRIGNGLKKIRNIFGITQKQMAGMLELSYTTYSNYENNNRLPRIDILKSIAEILHTTPENLIMLGLVDDGKIGGGNETDRQRQGTGND